MRAKLQNLSYRYFLAGVFYKRSHVGNPFLAGDNCACSKLARHGAETAVDFCLEPCRSGQLFGGMLAPPCGYLQGKLHEQRLVVHPQIFHGRVVHNCGYNLVSLHKLFEIFGRFLRQIAGYRGFFGAALGGLAAALLGAHYPKAGRALAQRAHTYNRELDAAERLARQGRVVIVAPESIEGMSTLKEDVQAIERLYQAGYHDAEQLRALE